MASAAGSSACIARRELHRGLPRAEHLFHRKTSQRLFVNGKEVVSVWGHYIELPRKSFPKECSHKMRHTTIIKAFVTMEASYAVQIEKGPTHDSNSQLNSSSYLHISQSQSDSSDELDEREKLRRLKISKANKGSVPWNKGRKHSPETLQKIRERTKIAMQDPKVKMKLINLGHAQSKETRLKIGEKLRKRWQQLREKQMMQESCLFTWQNLISEASRKGCPGEDELHWDSYEILNEQLKQEWLKSIEASKLMPRPKGSKRAPKSLEQRRKISEAISAKWADPGYRERVCTALSKYHDALVRTQTPHRRKPCGESVARVHVKEKPTPPKEIKEDLKIVKNTISKKRNGSPSYKDPMARSKLEMIKNIREQRATMEARKLEAIQKAKLLIAEAEEAAKALEMVALKSPLAQASLLETRKLIAEATWSIQSIERGELMLQNNGGEKSIYSGAIGGLFWTTAVNTNNDTSLNQHVSNGSPATSPSESCIKFNIVADDPLAHVAEKQHPSEVSSQCASPYLPDTADLQVDRVKVNGSISLLSLENGKKGTSNTIPCGSYANFASKTKKWLRGKLVALEED